MELLWAILVWTVFGLVCGALARLLVPGRQPIGILMTILLGVVGSFVGGFIAYVLMGGEPLQPSGFLMSLLGAVIVLAIYVSFSRNRGRAV
jgi:uncharacterized membrane protein YeaQ/YmgE (transglycosylase-associated protein family)